MKNVALLSQNSLSADQIKHLAERSNFTAFVENVKNRDEDEVIDRIGQAEIILINHVTPITDRVLTFSENLKYIITSTVGIDHIDMKACKERNIKVRWFPGYCARGIAENILCFMFLGLNKTLDAIKDASAGNWNYMSFRGRLCEGKSILIVGSGSTGSALKKLCELLGMVVHSVDSKSDYSLLDRLISECDIISINAALNENTRKMLDKRRIFAMKDNVILINTARGAIIDEDSLWTFLKTHPRAIAFLDVLENEPPARDAAWRNINNAVVTPHVTWDSEEGAQFIWNSIFNDICLALDDKWPLSDLKAGYL